MFAGFPLRPRHYATGTLVAGGRTALQAAALERTAGGAAVVDAVVREVSDAAAAVGIAPGTPEATEIARRLSEVDLGG